MQSLQQRRVVVTGASAGVGRTTTIAFARLGCRVGLVARGSDGLDGAQADVETAGGEALVLWTRNRMPRRPQPVPPIFQPEAVADAILEAVATAPRELWVGLPAVKAIVGNMVAPGWLDRILATQGYSGQQSREPADPRQPDNLFTPVRGDHGAHGRFDRRACAKVMTVDPATARAVGTASVAGLLAATLCLGYAGGRRAARTSRLGHDGRTRRGP